MMEIKCRIEQAVSDCYAGRDIHSVIAGVSGGADSVALLLATVSAGIDVRAVHCNFHLRGRESDRDERFVSRLCRRLGVPLDVVHFDVPEYMRTHGVSTEMACRDLRYAEFRAILDSSRYDRIAVAHNADDNAETLILNLMRGAGVAGLRGMLPDTGEIIRPLLSVSRGDIERYLNALGQQYVTDSTNLSCDYRRNFIRNRVLPLLETEWPGAKASIARSQANLREEERMLDWTEARLTDGDHPTLSYDVIATCPVPTWIIRRFIARFGGSAVQASEIACAIASAPTLPGKTWKVRDGRIATGRDRLEFIPSSADTDRIPAISHSVHKINEPLMRRIRRAPLCELWTVLPPEAIVFRHPRTGDRIRPLGMSGSTLVSKILKDARLSLAEKERTIVAEDVGSGEIIWISGLKRSRIHLIEPESVETHRYAANETEHIDPSGGFNFRTGNEDT